MLIRREDIPSSESVIIRSRPQVPGGSNTLAQILFNLRSIPGPDGVNGTELSSRELRDGLDALNLLPPGVDRSSKPESRIRDHILLLINDGNKPAVQPSDPANPRDRMALEDHRTAADLYKEAILDESYSLYGPLVQSALMSQYLFHAGRLTGSSPNRFDDDLEELVSLELENRLFAMEQSV
jgi:hypothetical protein